MKNEHSDLFSIEIILPCKCIMTEKLSKLTKTGGKFYIQSMTCQNGHGTYRDFILKKINNHKYRAITDKRKERKLFHDEERVMVDIYNTSSIGTCTYCEKTIPGKSITNIDLVRKTLWDVSVICPHCDMVQIIQVDERDIK